MSRVAMFVGVRSWKALEAQGRTGLGEGLGLGFRGSVWGLGLGFSV